MNRTRAGQGKLPAFPPPCHVWPRFIGSLCNYSFICFYKPMLSVCKLKLCVSILSWPNVLTAPCGGMATRRFNALIRGGHLPQCISRCLTESLSASYTFLICCLLKIINLPDNGSIFCHSSEGGSVCANRGCFLLVTF